MHVFLGAGDGFVVLISLFKHALLVFPRFLRGEEFLGAEFHRPLQRCQGEFAVGAGEIGFAPGGAGLLGVGSSGQRYDSNKSSEANAVNWCKRHGLNLRHLLLLFSGLAQMSVQFFFGKGFALEFEQAVVVVDDAIQRHADAPRFGEHCWIFNRGFVLDVVG